MPAFNPQGFGSGFDGGADTPASGSGAFYSGGFGAGFDGGIDTSSGGPLSPADIAAIAAAVRASMSAELSAMLEVWRIHGLDATAPLQVTPTSRVAGSIAQTIGGDGATSSTVTRA